MPLLLKRSDAHYIKLSFDGRRPVQECSGHEHTTYEKVDL
jgi:hypothetical protein